MTHVMIDCETLSLDPNAVVVSIGIVRFNPADFTIGTVREWVLDIQEQIDAGREISGSTLQWWMRQSEGARAPLTYPGQGVADALLEVHTNIDDAEAVWASAPDKDFPWMETLCRDFRVERFCNFRAQRCFRTLRDTFDPSFALAPVQFGDSHKASDDAMYQVLYLKNLVEHHRIPLGV